MTRAELNIAIAVKCGRCTCANYQKPGDWETAVCDHCGKNPFHAEHNLPDYTSCLNACADAEAMLTEAEFERYESDLWNIVAPGEPVQPSMPIRFSRRFLSATALQRSIALGLTWSLLTQEQADELREGGR